MSLEAELTRLRKRIKLLETELRRREQEQLSFREVREKIFGLAAQPLRPPKAWMAPDRGGLKDPGVPTLLISDVHYGETVAAKEAAGNAYNRAVARKRVEAVTLHALDIIRNHMVGRSPATMVVGLLGDIVSGEIHDELAKTNDGTLITVIPEAVDMLYGMLSTLAAALHDCNFIVPCVCGNHGRTTRKMEAKRFAPNNFDWLIYVMLERAVARSNFTDRVCFIIDESNEASWNIYGHRYLALHGHDLGVRGGDGIIGALGPIMRGRLKVAAQQRSVGRDFDTLVIGHWHQYITLPGLVVNGSIKGYDEFAARMLRAAKAPPVQALWYTHPKHGITCHWPVFAESHK